MFSHIATRVLPSVSKITLYASSNDKALNYSKKVKGGFSRAGDASEGPLVLAGMDTIDASVAEVDFLKHSYISGNRNVVSDLSYVLQGVAPKNRHGLKMLYFGNLPYWSLIP